MILRQVSTHPCTHTYQMMAESRKPSCGISQTEISLQTGEPFTKNSGCASWCILEHQRAHHSFGLQVPNMEADILPPPFLNLDFDITTWVTLAAKFTWLFSPTSASLEPLLPGQFSLIPSQRAYHPPHFFFFFNSWK